MPIDQPVNPGSFDTGGGGGGGLPTLGVWTVEDAFIRFPTDANAPSGTPTPTPITYNPKKEYILALNTIVTGTYVPVGALPTIEVLYPNDAGTPPQGFNGEGIGTILDPANGQVSFATSVGVGTYGGSAYIGSGGIFSGGAPGIEAGGIASDTSIGLGTFGFSGVDGTLTYSWAGFGSPFDMYYVTISRVVSA